MARGTLRACVALRDRTLEHSLPRKVQFHQSADVRARVCRASWTARRRLRRLLLAPEDVA